MLTLNNVATQDTYVDALTLGPVPTCEKVIYVVANASVIAQVAAKSDDKTTQPWGAEILVTPQVAEFNRLQGIRFRSAIPGSPAQIVAQLIEPGDVVPVGGTPFTAVLAATGGITPGPTNLVIPVYLPGTFPPSAPADGDLAVFLPDPVNLPGVRWLLMYNASSSSPYKWEVLGGSQAMYSTIDTYENIPAADGTWKNLATDGPFVTAPRAGDYECRAGCVASSAGSIRNDMFAGIAQGNGSPLAPLIDAIISQSGYAPEIPLSTDVLHLGVALGTALKLRYLVAVGGSAGTQFGRRWISVTPRRIS